jgi:hypothetical protein
MKNVLLKFIISNELNRSGRLSGFWRELVARSPEAARFERRVNELDRRLRQPADHDGGRTVPGLHALIMQAVRADRARRAQAERDTSLAAAVPFARWAWASAVGVSLGFGLWLAFWQMAGPGDSGPASPALARQADGLPLPSVPPLVEQLASNGVVIISGPMTRQLDDLARDLRETAQFLLASLP